MQTLIYHLLKVSTCSYNYQTIKLYVLMSYKEAIYEPNNKPRDVYKWLTFRTIILSAESIFNTIRVLVTDK